MTPRLQVVRDCYRAYETADRELIERCLSDDLVFFSPPDPGIDRAQYFERCWPGAGRLERYEFKRMLEAGNEVLVTYECTRNDGSRFRNTEVFTLNDRDQISRIEVYFGWDL
jgi:ketosteroid isomerase-like protein